jgi:protease II
MRPLCENNDLQPYRILTEYIGKFKLKRNKTSRRRKKMSKRENGLPRLTMNRKGKHQYIIEEKGQLFLIKQNKNIVVIPTEDMKWIIEKFKAILERKKQQRKSSQKLHYKVYEPRSARQQREKKQRSGQIK